MCDLNEKKPSIKGCNNYDICERRGNGAQWITKACSNINNETTFDSKSKSCRDPRVATCDLGNFHQKQKINFSFENLKF